MKKALLIIAVVLGSMTAFAQNLDKNEAKQLKAFLAEGHNASALKASPNSVASIEGVSVSNGHVTAIQWKDKKLTGSLDLSGFKALTKVDVSRNNLTSLDVSDCVALEQLNAGRNKLTEVSLDGCSVLQNLSLYKNRLTDLSLSNTPLLKSLNISNNLFVELELKDRKSVV